MSAKKVMSLGIVATVMGFSVAAPAHAAVVIEYDAATAGAGNEPQDVSPAWTLAGSASYWTNDGTKLIQNTPAGATISTAPATNYAGPQVAGLMVRGGTDYSIEFKVKPISDAKPSVDWYARDVITWADNFQSYAVSIDKHTTDDSGNGKLGYASGYISGLPAVIDNIDWSTPRTIGISYTGSNNTFTFFLDGVVQGTLGADAMRHNVSPYAGWQNTVAFGSPTTAGGAVENEWYSFRVSNTAIPVPEPTAMSLVGIAGAALLRRSRR